MKRFWKRLSVVIVLVAALFLVKTPVLAQDSPCGGATWCAAICSAGGYSCNQRNFCGCTFDGDLWSCVAGMCSCWNPYNCGGTLQCQTCGGGGPVPTPDGGGCTPTACTPACGQTDGCGGTCGNTDSGAPVQPVISFLAHTPTTDGAGRYYVDTDDTGKIFFSWDTPAKTTMFDLEIRPYIPADASCTGTGGLCPCSHADSRCDNPWTDNTREFRPRHRYYRIRVRAGSDTCGATQWSTRDVEEMVVLGRIEGHVYQDANNTALVSGGACTRPGGNVVSTIVNNATTEVAGVGEGMNGTADPRDTTQTYPGRYRMYLPYWNPGNNTLTLTPPAGYTCSCPTGCVYTGVESPWLAGAPQTQQPYNFYVCAPTCTGNQCGQADGCGGVCPATDSGSPTQPAVTSPANNAQVTRNGLGQVVISFTRPALTDRVQIRIRPQGVPQNCFGASQTCAYINAGTTYNFNVNPNIANYTVDVIAENTSCGTQVSLPSTAVNFTVVDDVNGTVYLDPANTATLSGGNCTTGSAVVGSNAGSPQVTVVQNATSYNGTVGATGAYSVVTPITNLGAGTATVNINAGYVCTCPLGCQYGGISTPRDNLNFFVSNMSAAWYQVTGGPVVAYQTSGNAIRSYIPASCVAPGCQPYLIRQAAGANSSGYILTGGGSSDLSANAGNQSGNIDQDARNINAVADPQVAQEQYAFFRRQYKFPQNALNDFDGTAGRPTMANAVKPNHTPRNNGIAAYYSTGNVTIGTAWTVAANESIVVFVDGNLSINQTISVANGGFLAFIVSGNIAIAPTVGHTNLALTTPNVVGVYIADGEIQLPTQGAAAGGDLKFVGEGTFVGWSGIQLSRDYGDGALRGLENNVRAVENFIYRPDFLVRAPTEMKVPHVIWEEIAP